MMHWLGRRFLPLAALCAALALSLPAGSTPQLGRPEALKPGAVIYGVVPAFFGRAGYRAVTEKLDYLQDQGVDALWIAPVNSTDDPIGISYSVTDHTGLREDLGSAEELREMVREAQARGMKVMLDIVPNHTSHAHPFFRDAKARGPASEYYSHYERDEEGEARHYFDWAHLPNLNLDNPAVTAMLANAFHYWVREFGFDGYRVDVAWGPRARRPGFWEPLIKSLRQEKPGLVMLAEASARDAYYTANGFDLAYDWTEELGKWAWEPAFKNPKQLGDRIHAALTTGGAASARTVRFLNNNDTGDRFVTRHGVAFTKVAAVLQHTVPGIPIVYTGDEVGAAYQPYEQYGPIDWRDRAGLQAWYRRLAELREELPSLHSGEFVPVLNEKRGAAYAYLRSLSPVSFSLVLLNFGPARRVRLDVPEPYRAELAKGPLRDALTGAEVSLEAHGGLSWNAKAQSALVLTPRR